MFYYFFLLFFAKLLWIQNNVVSLHRNLSEYLFKMDDYHAENMN